MIYYIPEIFSQGKRRYAKQFVFYIDNYTYNLKKTCFYISIRLKLKYGNDLFYKQDLSTSEFIFCELRDLQRSILRESIAKNA